MSFDMVPFINQEEMELRDAAFPWLVFLNVNMFWFTLEPICNM